MPTPNAEYFPDLNIPSMGGPVSPQMTIMVWADATKAFACTAAEIPDSEKSKMRGDGYPALHIGERNLALMGDHLGVWAQTLKRADIPQLATIDSHNWNDPLQMKELAVYGEHADENSFEAEVVDAVAPYIDYRIAKTTFDSFFETDLKEQLEGLHEGLHPLQVCVVVGGFVTHIVVSSIVQRATAMGYQVVVPSFLVGDFKRIHHNNFLRNVFPAWGVNVVSSESELCDLLGIPAGLPAEVRG